MSLRDVTEGHFESAFWTHKIFLLNKIRMYSYLPCIKADYCVKWLIFDSYFWSKTKLFLFFRHGGTSHGGTFYLSLEHSPSGDFLYIHVFFIFELFIMHITRNNNYWIVSNNVQNSPIKSIKMNSLFSENSKNKAHQSPVTFQDLPRKPIII